MDDLDDAAIESRLRTIPSDGWTLLWSAVDELLAPGSGPHSEWIFNSGQLPYIRYSEAVDAVTDALYQAGVVVEFDWRHWDGLRRYEGGQDLAAASVAESVRVLTAMLRSERFVTGTIVHLLEDGTLAAALRRLRAWHTARVSGPTGADGRGRWGWGRLRLRS